MTTRLRLLFALLTGAPAVLLGCRDSSVVDVPPPASNPQASLLDPVLQPTGLLYCSPVPYEPRGPVTPSARNQ